MTEPSQKPERGVSRRLIDAIRGVVAALLHPVTAISFPVVSFVARRRKRAGLRLPAGSQAARVFGAARASGPSSPPWHSTGDAEYPRLDPALRTVVPIGRAHAHTSAPTKHKEVVWIIRVEPVFRPRDYARTFTALQLPMSAKLLDLTPARLICADLFDRLAGAWTAPPGTVPRLGC